MFSRAEHLRVIEITLEEAKGKVPVVAGAGGSDTRAVAAATGPAAILPAAAHDSGHAGATRDQP